jgi:hypothetical protein
MNLGAVISCVSFLARPHVDRLVAVVDGKTRDVIGRELRGEHRRRQAGERVQQNAAHDEKKGGGHG